MGSGVAEDRKKHVSAVGCLLKVCGSSVILDAGA